MKFLVLGAGYGTRLEKGIREDPTGKYKDLIGVPKPLIPLAGKPLISYWLDQMLECGKFTVEDFFIVCNEYNYNKFVDWAKSTGVPVGNIWNDGSTSNANRLGAVVDVEQMIVNRPVLGTDDLIVVGGDTLFFEDFDLGNLINVFKKKDTNMVLWYHDEETEKTGILETDENDIVTAFLEKPARDETKSRRACPCFYMYKKETLSLLDKYIKQTTTMKERDAPGNFPAWLHKFMPIYVYECSGRFDIGGLQSYIDADAVFVERKQRKEKMTMLKTAIAVGAVAVLAIVALKKGGLKSLLAKF